MSTEKKRRYENNCKAPRFRPKTYTTKLITKELYEDWKKENPEFAYISFSEFKEIWWMMCDIITDYTVDNTEGVRIPYYIGDLSIQYIPKKAVDDVASSKVGYRINHSNLHSNRKTGKIIWSVSHARKKNKYVLLYAFHPCKRFEKKASGGIFNTPEKYKDSKLAKWQLQKIKNKKV